MAIVMKGRKKVLLLITDDGHSFDQVLFYGNELTLLLFDVLTFCITDYIFTNYIVAGVITYLMSEVSELCHITADHIFIHAFFFRKKEYYFRTKVGLSSVCMSIHHLSCKCVSF